MFQCRQDILILHTTQEALITCHCIYVEWVLAQMTIKNARGGHPPPTEHARAYFTSHWPLLVALTFKAKLHLRQSSLKYNSNRRSKQYSRMIFCKGASSLLYCQGACVLHEHNVAMHCCMCPLPNARWKKGIWYWLHPAHATEAAPGRNLFTSGKNAIFDCPLQQRRFICGIWYGVRPAPRLLGSTSKIVALQL